MSIEALIGFIISVGLASQKFNDMFDDMCKKRKDKKEAFSKKAYPKEEGVSVRSHEPTLRVAGGTGKCSFSRTNP
jgi:hypothetical protein